MHAKPKKGLGQHFLFDRNIQRKIISSCKLKAKDIVLEIGAGRAELTRLLGRAVSRVYALEIDTDLINILKQEFKGAKKIRIINQDILRFNLNRYFNKLSRIKVIGNIPYYITTPIIEHLIKFRDRIDSIFITVQKEFARRMTAGAGSKDYGAFSCFVQYYTEPKIIFFIKRTSFSPQPEVDSCFLRLKMRGKTSLSLKDEELLFKIIRRAFNQRRKTLRNSLRDTVNLDSLEMFFKKYSMDKNIRPEELSLKDFVHLAKAVKKPLTS